MYVERHLNCFPVISKIIFLSEYVFPFLCYFDLELSLAKSFDDTFYNTTCVKVKDLKMVSVHHNKIIELRVFA